MLEPVKVGILKTPVSGMSEANSRNSYKSPR
jgi:hypothetical protein